MFLLVVYEIDEPASLGKLQFSGFAREMLLPWWS